MPLNEYRRKGNFRETPEPAAKRQKANAGRGKAGKQIFVVQKHQASRLHYDFRLTIDGVMASWAIPKGPTLDPTVKHLAARTEDHPIEYANFEGVIPEGSYGAGAVMIWDIGTFETKGDATPAEQLRSGELKLILNGRKLQGEFVLVQSRMGGKSNWLLIKRRDEHAKAGWNPESAKLGRSVVTNRTLQEIAAA